MTVSVHVRGVFSVIADNPETLDAHTDELMDQLLALEDDNLTDAGVGVELSSGGVEIEVLSRAETFEEAVENASAAIRTAIHAAGGSTPVWDFRPRAQHAELISA